VVVLLNCDMTISQQIAKRWAICEEIRPEPDMNREVEFLFDYGSPFSYLANLQIEGFAKRNGAAVTYTPILLAAVLKATGNASPMTIPAKGHATWRPSCGVGQHAMALPSNQILTGLCPTRCG
jgi:DSBA-like thioredoxin domain